jgi:hypothetical protein
MPGQRDRTADWELRKFFFCRSTLGRTFTRRINKLRFLGAVSRHLHRERLRERQVDTSAIWTIARLAANSVVLAVGAIVFLVGIPLLYDRWSFAANWALFSLPVMSDGAYVSLMATIAQVAAGTLALIFTAISVVTSTRYATVTTNIRLLIVRDEINRIYLGLLAHLAAVAVAAGALIAVGIGPSRSLAIYAVVSAAVCLLAFIPIGVRTFTLFDASNLIGTPVRAFSRALESVTSRGKRWLDPSFQSHASRVANGQLAILSELVDYELAQTRTQNEILLKLVSCISYVAREHATRKAQIPSSSLWFAKRAEFKRWDLVDSYMTSIAIQTGISPQPDQVPNHGFVEQQCGEMVIRCLDRLLSIGALNDATSVLLRINTMATTYAQMFEQHESLVLAARARDIVTNWLSRQECIIDPIHQLQLADTTCVISLAPVLAPSVALTEMNVEQCMQVVGPTLELDERRAHSIVAPHPVKKRVEEMLGFLKFERLTEGTQVTQPWYMRQMIAYAYADFIRDLVKGIADAIDQEFVAAASGLAGKNRPYAMVTWLHRSIEACNKATAQIEALKSRYEEFKTFQVCDTRWLPLGEDDSLERVRVGRATVFRMLAEIIPDLSDLPSDSSLPDLLGQSRARIANELLSMMEEKREENFAELFLAFFNATIQVERYFFEFATQPGRNDYIRVAIDATMDLMELSGIAYIFSELDDTHFSLSVSKLWDAYFNQAADKRALLKALYATTDSTFGLPIFSTSAMQRHDWESRVACAMAARGIDTDSNFGTYGYRRTNTHRSPVIESIHLMYGRPMHPAWAYFGALYLARREEAAGEELPHEIESCIDAIERVRQERTGGDDATEAD